MHHARTASVQLCQLQSLRTTTLASCAQCVLVSCAELPSVGDAHECSRDNGNLDRIIVGVFHVNMMDCSVKPYGSIMLVFEGG